MRRRFLRKELLIQGAKELRRTEGLAMTGGKGDAAQTAGIPTVQVFVLNRLAQPEVFQRWAARLRGELPGKRRRVDRAWETSAAAPVVLRLALDLPRVKTGFRGDAVPPQEKGGVAPEWQPEPRQHVARDSEPGFPFRLPR